MIVVFDLDGVLVSLDKRTPYRDTQAILEHCVLKGYHVALASANDDAALILRHFGWTILFDLIIGTSVVPKSLMLQQIRMRFHRAQRMVFFDDQSRNVDAARAHGFEAHKINPKEGLTMYEFRRLFLAE